MKNLTSSELREKFLQYFEKNGHLRVKSSSLVPSNDPTLFFTNAGMVQFKENFLGEAKPASPRATTSQKCMRVSGKHNDLENVGYTPRHHTFFEMLGNFSFGDYFKKEAIAFAWEFLTKELGLDPKRMCVTVFREDDEAEELWLKHVSKDKIFRLDEKDNFWSMGDTGPCGPCSEIMWDFEPGPATREDLDTTRFMEIWNLVFMQFNRSADGTMTPLPKPSVDTGMGLERLCAVVQGKRANWDSDVFTPLIEHIEKVTGCKRTDSEQAQVAMRVIADHVRASAFLIADGVTPSNEGRGYVLRRIMRRAIRYGKLLGKHEPFFTELLPTLFHTMALAYPELVEHKAFIVKVIHAEEERFHQTLQRGLELLETEFKKMKPGSVLAGEVIFKLYDTFGFPKDLTEMIAREQGFILDEPGFEKCMNEQRERARANWKGSGEEKVSSLWHQLESHGLNTNFVGYNENVAEGRVLAIVRDGLEAPQAASGEKVQVVFDCTPFYAEGGGQVGDSGFAESAGVRLKIANTKKPLPTLFVHEALVEQGTLKVGDILTLNIDQKRRAAIRSNHTATHLLHAALRKTLGEHVKQAGSMVDEHHLRFDFAHFQALSAEELQKINKLVNEAIQRAEKVETFELPQEEAVKRGALAFFGEKYGSQVRMVQVGDFSKELCGGTHARNTLDIKKFTIVSEGSVAAGVRRIEAVTADEVARFEQAQREKLAAMAEQEKLKQAQKGELKQKLMQVRDLLDWAKAEKVGDSVVLVKDLPELDSKALAELANSFVQLPANAVMLIGSSCEGKVALIAKVAPDLINKVKAGEIIKEVTPVVGGKGGGKPDYAQGGGTEPAKLGEALKQGFELIKKHLAQ